MAVRTIVKETEHNPVLRARAKEVEPGDLKAGRFKTLIADMVETMYAANGVGIAAPQVGESVRLFIAESPDGPIALANPVIVKKSWKMAKDEEGCLSVPGKFDKVKRFKSITMNALAADGTPVSFTAHDFFARILQHETDHLDGVLFIDRVAEQKKGKL